MTTIRHTTLLLLLVGAASLAPAAPSPDAQADSSSPIYHLRIVRVSPADVEAGAALGYTPNGVEPVVLPEDEAWGTEEQLDALARTLGGARTTAVTGFWLEADAAGAARFDREVYVGESVLRVRLEARPQSDADRTHELHLTVGASDTTAPPIAEARLRVRTDRTVAIASPAALDNDWLVVAVTLLDPAKTAERIRRAQQVSRTSDAGVVMPEILHKVTPRYPENARRRKLQGEVTVRVIVDREGIPRAPLVREMSPGCEELASAAVDTVQQWRFQPGTLGGDPAPVSMDVTVVFRLE